MEKWNLPPEPLPSWLDPKDEITAENDTKPKEWSTLSKHEMRPLFVITCFKALRKLGLSHKQCLEVLANAVVETGWGGSFRAWNLGGWKIRKADVDAAKGKGKPLKWWRAPGNKGAGDPPWCYYMGFDSLSDFFSLWIDKFIPEPGTVGKSHRYYQTGVAFWTGGDWFRELCKAGYKGEVTAAKPEGSIRAHGQIIAMATTFLCQDGLKVTVDGEWGTKSKEACKKAEKEHGLPETGNPSLELLVKLWA